MNFDPLQQAAGVTRTGGRPASKGVIPGDYALSVGKPSSQPPPGWQWISLGEVARLETGHTPSRRHPEYWGGQIPWIGIRDATGNHGATILETQQYTNRLGIENSSARVLPANTVCLSRTASVGYVVVMGRPMATSQDFVNWVCSPHLDYRFLKYILLSEREALLRYASGTTHQTIYFPEAKAFHVCIPGVAEQERIVGVLQVLDDRIALLRETNATLEAIAQALFKSWFVDFDPVRAKSQGLAPAGMDEATAALFPDGFEESALGQVPRAWPIFRIEELAERVGMGPFGSNIKVETFVAFGVPVLSGANVQGALLEDLDFRFVTEEHASRLRNSCVREGDIVLTHRGTLGQVSLVPGGSKYPEYVLSQSQFFVRCSRSIIEPEWLLYFLRSPLGQHLLLANASQVGVPSIARPTSYLRSIGLVVPPISIVSRFAEAVRSLHGGIVENRQRMKTLATLRDTLLPRLISGQLRLPEADAVAEGAV